MVAVGYTIDGYRKEFECSDGILCSYNDLVSLEIPYGVKYVWCYNNQLSELILPEGVTNVYCHNNLLTELIIPNGVKTVYCDKEIKGLEEFIGNIKIELW